METYVIYSMMVFFFTLLLTLATMFDPHMDTIKSPLAWTAVVVGAVFTLWAAVVL